MKDRLEGLVQTLRVRWRRELWHLFMMYDIFISCLITVKIGIYDASIASPGCH